MSAKKIAALDIGGTQIKAALFEDGVLRERRETNTLAAEGPASLLRRSGDLIADFGAPDAVGISTAGQVDVDTGVIRYANDNLPGYTGTNVRGYFSARFACPCAVLNDAMAAALGEGARGAAQGCADYICITYGTGVGGGIVLGNRPYYGAGGSANPLIGGLITHPELTVRGDPFAGSYERSASATALVAAAKRLDPTLTNGRVVFAQLADPNVQAVVDHWLDEVAAGLLSLLHLFNVPCLVLGGGVLEQPYVIEGLRARVREEAIPGFETARVAAALLGNAAGLYGAMQSAAQLL
jgi:predicted NBD/HSP70 family sugar kinase